MTLLNTLSNLGSKIAETFVLFFVDFVSEKRCDGASSSISTCSTKNERDMCVEAGGKCHLDDGHYHTFVLLSPVLALAWVVWQRKRVQKLSASPLDEWHLSTSRKK